MEDATPQSKGGQARAKALTKEERSAIARKASAGRWAKNLPAADYTGDLDIGGAKISCAVLSDGTRVLTQSDMMRALGRARQAKGRAFYNGDVNLPAFITAQNLKPFIPSELYVTSSQVEFLLPSGHRAFGYRAEMLPQICEVYLKARDAGALKPSQQHVAKQADILMRGLAKVGIVALVDEATGFQKDRAADALSKILEAFITEELQPWVKTFPDEFYSELFRLRGLDYPHDTVRRPQYFGYLTTDIIYDRLAPGVKEELKKVTPKTQKGRLSKHLHRSLTPELGHPKLREHMSSVVTIMKLSEDYDDFHQKLDRLHPKYGETIALPLPSPRNRGL